MKRYPPTSRADYEAIQRARTESKWTLNGITREEVAWLHARVPPFTGPILCLGVRNGLEVDLFREIFGGEVQGVELHERGARPDVWIGSFDAMPAEWAGRFALLYSNALDHAFDPAETAREWCRVAQPGALLALTLDVVKPPTESDPIAQITPVDLATWFGGEFAGEFSPTSLLLTDADTVHVLWRLP